MRWILGTVAAILVLAAAALVWRWTRWSPLPVAETPPGAEELLDPAWSEAAEAGSVLLSQRWQDAGLPAISAAVGACGELIWAEAVGWAEVEAQHPVTLGSRFRIGSVSKSVTGVALGRLVELDRIDLDEPIRSYLSDYAHAEQPITSRLLASHMAGIRHYKWRLALPPNDFYSNRRYDSVRASVAAFEDDPLLFAPGTDFSYTTHGFTLLSAVMEAADGRPFLALLQEEVFDPAGMVETTADDKARELSQRVGFYEVEEGRYRRASAVDLSNKWAGGGLLSTPRDLVRLGNALLSDRILEPATRAKLFEPQRLASGEVNPQSYGLGWRRSTTDGTLAGDGSYVLVSHGGSSAGGSAWLGLFPEETLVLAGTVNAGTGSAVIRSALLPIAELFMEELLRRGCPSSADPVGPEADSSLAASGL